MTRSDGCSLVVFALTTMTVAAAAVGAPGRELSVQAVNADEFHRADAAQMEGPALHLVRFAGPVRDEWLAALEAAGAKPIHYVATNGYLIWADAPATTLLSQTATAGDSLEYIGPYPHALKMGPAIAERADPDEVVQVVIQMYRHARCGAAYAACHGPPRAMRR